MSLQEIKVENLDENIFSLMAKEWMLVTTGNSLQFNPMTASWGGLGHLWNKVVVFLFIRPNRFTYQLMEQNAICSVSFLNSKYRNILEFCGTKSGFNVDKIKSTGLRPFFKDQFMFYEEAYLMMGCKKIYYQDLKPENFLDGDVENFYPKRDYHRMYICEVEIILRSDS